MTPEQISAACRQYINSAFVARNETANLDSEQLAEVVAGLAADPQYASPYTLRDGQAAEILTVIDAELNPPVPQPDPPRPLTPREFMDRFTDEELDAIQLAVLNGSGMVQIVAMRAQRRLFTQLEVLLDHPDTTTLLGALVQVGLLSAERVPQILETA